MSDASDVVPIVIGDEFRSGADWGSLIEGYEQQEDQPDPSSMAATDVSKMLGSLRRLYGRLADYETLHMAEVARLDDRRGVLVGPLVKRIQQLEASLRQYAIRSFLDFGKTGTIIATPNGVIRASRDLVPEIDVDAEVVAGWVRRFGGAHVVEAKPQVRMAPLRQWLATLEENGVLRRAIASPLPGAWNDSTPRSRVILNSGDEYRKPLVPGEHGVWIDEEGNIMPGLSWAPAGDDGSGRSFTIQAI